LGGGGKEKVRGITFCEEPIGSDFAGVEQGGVWNLRTEWDDASFARNGQFEKFHFTIRLRYWCYH